jgi:UDP:flavonoid glycosyltransferase YjiC (YdhE family)
MIIHHGGSGTTHSAMRCKKPQGIIPHLGDQFFWNRQIEKSKFGVSGFPIDKWSSEYFEILLDKLLLFKSS